MCHLLLAYWSSVKCPNFAALSCCVCYFHVHECRVLDCAHCTSFRLILLCAYFVDVVRDALHRCMDRARCVYRTHRMFSGCAYKGHFWHVLRLFNVVGFHLPFPFCHVFCIYWLSCTVLCLVAVLGTHCFVVSSLFCCVAILAFGWCARFGWCPCSSFLVNVFCWVFWRCWEIEMLWKL